MAVIVAWLGWAIEHLRQWLRPPSAPAGDGQGLTIGGNVTTGRDFVGRDRIVGDRPDEQ